MYFLRVSQITIYTVGFLKILAGRKLVQARIGLLGGIGR